ncbi:hypothetical protein FN846DRAFT_913280 [Sphaerosporella brunnea]|uniref:Uncharacterized protein n=1 Tax=Sphaerosporella brunnea TaxID=1250544 RepID=A0A5J5EGK5_9PEZI|nr:hypothetical protein FN846DRAFT_913280 [Sphaerosporella brunnea]
MSEAKAVGGINHLLMASDYTPLPETMKATKMTKDQQLPASECHPHTAGLRIPAPVFLEHDDVLNEKLITIVHNAYDDLCELSGGNLWPADVRYAKPEECVVAPDAAAFAAAIARERAPYVQEGREMASTMPCADKTQMLPAPRSNGLER